MTTYLFAIWICFQYSPFLYRLIACFAYQLLKYYEMKNYYWNNSFYIEMLICSLSLKVIKLYGLKLSSKRFQNSFLIWNNVYLQFKMHVQYINSLVHTADIWIIGHLGAYCLGFFILKYFPDFSAPITLFTNTTRTDFHFSTRYKRQYIYTCTSFSMVLIHVQCGLIWIGSVKISNQCM